MQIEETRAKWEKGQGNKTHFTNDTKATVMSLVEKSVKILANNSKKWKLNETHFNTEETNIRQRR